MGRLQSGSCDGANPNPNDHEQESPRNYCDKVRTGGCEPIEKEVWNPDGLVICRSCGQSRWLQSRFGYSQTGLDISALVCRECYDLCVVRHVRYKMPHFIMAAYYVATVTDSALPKYERWKPCHTFKTQASRPSFDRLQPAVPKGFHKGKLW
jgi:hypothetical protein